MFVSRFTVSSNVLQCDVRMEAGLQSSNAASPDTEQEVAIGPRASRSLNRTSVWEEPQMETDTLGSSTVQPVGHVVKATKS